jgi:hypothetical protein
MVYAYTAPVMVKMDEPDYAADAENRSRGAALLALIASRKHGHSDDQFAEAAAEMYEQVGKLHADDAYAFAEFLDCADRTKAFSK